MEKSYCSVPATAAGTWVFHFIKSARWSSSHLLREYSEPLSGVKRPGRDENLLPLGTELKNGYIYTSTLTVALLTWTEKS